MPLKFTDPSGLCWEVGDGDCIPPPSGRNYPPPPIPPEPGGLNPNWPLKNGRPGPCPAEKGCVYQGKPLPYDQQPKSPLRPVPKSMGTKD